MKKKHILLVLMLFFAWLLPIGAQSDSTAKTSVQEAPNFFKIRQQTLAKWGGKNPGPGNGYKTFKRWENFWESRVLPDGSFPNPNQNDQEWANFQKKHPKTTAESSMPANWTSLGSNSSAGGYSGLGRVNCIAFHPTNPAVIWAGTPAGGLWKSTNGGSNWSPVTDNHPWAFTLGVSSIAIDPSTPNTMYIATGDKDLSTYYPMSVGILKSVDGGITWNATGALPTANTLFLVNRVVINPTNSAIILVSTNEWYSSGGAPLGGLYRSTNSGATWKKVKSGDHFNDIEFKPGSSSIVYATSTNTFFRSTNAGLDWTPIATIPGSGRLEMAVTPNKPAFVALLSSKSDSDPHPLDAQGFNGLYYSDNSGGLIKARYLGPKNLLSRLSDGNGLMGQGLYDLCIAVSPANANTIFIGGVNTWKSTDGGFSWALANFWKNDGSGVPVVHADKHCFEWQNSTTLFEGNDGGLYRTTNNGGSWTDLTNTMVINQIQRIGVSNSDNKVICGLQDNGTKLKSASGSWSDAMGGDGMECFIDPGNSAVMYGEQPKGYLLRSLAGGNINSWEPINLPGVTDPDHGLGAWITPWVMDPNNSSILYVGYAGVWKGLNQGQSWEDISGNLNTNTTLLTSLAVAPSNSLVLYVSTGTGIWKTSNGGPTWTSMASGLPLQNSKISYITVDLANPNKVYVTLSSYSSSQKVFRSVNGGSWENISGSLPNVPANCLTIQPGGNDALYVGTDIGVFYRDANMSDWVSFNGGLPNVIVTELECKTSNNTIIAATFGRGLWQSGYFSGSSSNTLSIAPASQSVAKNAGNVPYTISANGSWTISDNASWLSVTPASGTGNATINAAYTVNTGINARSATITVTSGNLSATATLLQAGIGGSTCNVPSGLKAVNIGQTSALFKWNAVSYATSYSLQYRALPSGSWTNTSPATVTGTSITINGLSLGVTYELRIQTNCSNGFSSTWSNALSFTTVAPPVCDIPFDLLTSNITQSSILASWTPVPGAINYTLQTREVPTGPWLNTNPPTFANTAITINGFLPNTPHEWRVRANCSNGASSNWSDPMTFFTLPLTCLAPANLSTSNITQNTALFSWSAVSGAASYTLQFNSGGNWVDLGGPPFTSTSISLFGLLVNSYYEWRVITNCSNGTQSEPSNVRAFYTATAPTCFSVDAQWPLYELNPQVNPQYVNQMRGGDFSVVNVSYGTTYTFSFCAANSGFINFDGEIYLFNGDGSYMIAYNNTSNCSPSSPPKLVWQAGYTGQVLVLLNKYLCSLDAMDSKMMYKVGAGFTGEDSDDRAVDAAAETRGFVLLPKADVAVSQSRMVPEPESAVAMKVFPNPATGVFNVEFDNGKDAAGSVNMYVYDLLSNVVWERTAIAQDGLNTWEVKSDNWPAGVYMVRLLTAQGAQGSQKIYVQKP